MHNSSPICVDANLVFRFVAVPEDEAIQRLWRGWWGATVAVTAPLLLRYEVTNALHRLRQAGVIPDDEAQKALRAALALPITLISEERVHISALAFARRFSLPAAYDAHYLALADHLGAELWTADRRLANTVRHALPWVHLVG